VDSPFDQVFEFPGGGFDTIEVSSTFSLADFPSIEGLSAVDPGSTDRLNLTGNDAQNLLIGNAGPNRLDGGGGADTLKGLQGDDIYIVENPGDIVIEAGGQGRDQVLTSVSYALQRSASIEVLSASSLASTAPLVLKGSDAGNTIRGNSGANKLMGLGGNDVLVGNGGNDLISGGAGKDRLTGSKGRDSFLFDEAPKSNNADVIVDFSPVHDTIRIDNADFREVGRNGRPAEDALVFGSAAADASDRLIYDQTSGALYYDPDGTGAAAQVRMATLANKAALTLSDFLIV
jgi:Ca2+-binding RTX toxin-like protein